MDMGSLVIRNLVNGVTIDLDIDDLDTAEDWNETITSKFGDDEWDIIDQLGFGGLDVRSLGLEGIEELFDQVTAYHAIEEVADFVEAFGYDVEDVTSLRNDFESASTGHATAEDWAWTYAEDCLCLRGAALDYFDAEKFARDAQLGGDITVTDSNVFYSNW